MSAKTQGMTLKCEACGDTPDPDPEKKKRKEGARPQALAANNGGFWGGCARAANDGSEPKVNDAASCTNVRYGYLALYARRGVFRPPFIKPLKIRHF